MLHWTGWWFNARSQRPKGIEIRLPWLTRHWMEIRVSKSMSCSSSELCPAAGGGRVTEENHSGSTHRLSRSRVFYLLVTQATLKALE
jgi:hypothetical protein